MPNSVTSTSSSRSPHVWQPDSSARKCTICMASFNLIRRKHHCRKCGSVICNDCSLHRLRIPVTRLALESLKSSSRTASSSRSSSISSHNDAETSSESDVVRVCDTCYSKHQQLKAKRHQKARAHSIEHEHTNTHEHTSLSRQSSRQSSRHSSPSSVRSSIHITNEHNVPITHQFLRPASSNQLATLSPHAPAQASVLPSVPSLPRTPRQIDDAAFSLSKHSEQRIRSQSSSDTLFTTTTITPSSALRRSMTSNHQSDSELTLGRAPSPINHLEIVHMNNSSSLQPKSSPSQSSSQARTTSGRNDVISNDMMSPKAVHHRSEFVPPAWCDNVLAMTGIPLPFSHSSSTEQNAIQSAQTESFMDSLQILSWIEPLIKLFNSFSAAFVDRPVACMMIIPLILLVLHRLRPFYSTLLVVMQLFTLHNAVWHHLSSQRNMEEQTIRQTLLSILHMCLHGVLAPFKTSKSKSSAKASDNRTSDIAWLCFGLLACYLTYFVRWPLFWSACIVRDLTKAVVKKQPKLH